MSQLLFLISLFLSLNHAFAVFQGKVPKADELPYLVGVVWATGGPAEHEPLQSPCSGVLLCENVVATAYHCVQHRHIEDFIKPNYKVTTDMGEKEPISPKSKGLYGVSDLFFKNLRNIAVPTPEGFVPVLDGIVLMKLDKTTAVKTFPKLADTKAPELRRGNPLTIAGYGYTKDSATSHRGTLHAGETQFETYAKATFERNEWRGESVEAPDHHIVALKTSANQVAGCAADSGGAFLSADTLVGITSIISDRRCINPTLTMAVSIAANRDWIDPKLKSWCPRTEVLPAPRKE